MEGLPDKFDQPIIPEVTKTPESKEGLPPYMFTFYYKGKEIDVFPSYTPEGAVAEFEVRNGIDFTLDEGYSFSSVNTKDAIFTE